ncbi:hypothetical protein Rs2_44342 [Raphanus sativus]|nr:hypothetical protein Rs2_44342 [Raphanus sativus]
MATNACKFIASFSCLPFVSSDIYLKQSKTGKMIKNTPEWEVRLTNPCPCIGTDIVLSCVGFKSLTPIDRSQRYRYLVTSVRSSTIYMAKLTLFFKYVWTEEFDIRSSSGTIACS